MLNYRLALIFIALLLAAPSNSRTQEFIKTKEFSFTSQNTMPSTRAERFCLPLEERLVTVRDVVVRQSNSKSVVNVTPDLNSNCVNMTIEMPPAQSVCTDFPKVSGFPPNVTMEKLCNTVPAVISFVLQYESRPATNRPPP